MREWTPEELETIAILILRGSHTWQIAQGMDCTEDEAEDAVALVRSIWEADAEVLVEDGASRGLAKLGAIQDRAWTQWQDSKDPRFLRIMLDAEKQIGVIANTLPSMLSRSDGESVIEALWRSVSGEGQKETQEKDRGSAPADYGYPPAWMTWELSELLAQITGLNARKKRTTILRLAEGRAIGRSTLDTLKLPETCTKSTWDGQYREGGEPGEWVQRPGWKHDPLIQEVLAAAEERAQKWQDTAEGRRVAKRQENVAAARDKLAEIALPVVLELAALVRSAQSEEVKLKAIIEALDRVSEETASKRPDGGQASSSTVVITLPDNRRGDGPPAVERADG